MKTKPLNGYDTFSNIKTHSVEEILAEGGATDFATKMGKDRDSLIKALENVGSFEHLTEQQWKDAMDILASEK